MRPRGAVANGSTITVNGVLSATPPAGLSPGEGRPAGRQKERWRNRQRAGSAARDQSPHLQPAPHAQGGWTRDGPHDRASACRVPRREYLSDSGWPTAGRQLSDHAPEEASARDDLRHALMSVRGATWESISRFLRAT